MTATAPIESPTTYLPTSVQALARARAAAALTKSLIDEARREFEHANSELFALYEREKSAVDNAELVVRSLALKEHERIRARKLCKGVEIVTSKSYEITDANAALAWAKASNVGLVPESFDAKIIKKVAQSTALSFVTVTETPSVRISTDLRAAVGAEG